MCQSELVVISRKLLGLSCRAMSYNVKQRWIMVMQGLWAQNSLEMPSCRPTRGLRAAASNTVINSSPAFVVCKKHTLYLLSDL